MRKLDILLLDDEKRITEELAEYLSSNNFTVHTADRPSAALSILHSHEIDIALVDIKLPEYSGLEFIRRIKETHPAVETVVMSGHGDMDSAIEAFRLGAFDYLRKPFSVYELQASIARTKCYIEAQRGARRYADICAELNREMAGSILIGQSRALDTVRRLILEAAENSSSPVVITGESGTGKELAARHIHAAAGRKSGRFAAVNCAAVPREVFESEFFGHEKGAFTDAHTARSGLFRSADGGTLFLDEVSEIPLDLQSKLLRAIETGTIRPVGCDREISVDVRIICATNKPLKQAAEEKLFRTDLYYRLAVIEINMPPLRERRDDIPILAQHFLNHFLEGTTAANAVLADELQTQISHAELLGNVRELKNLMERAAMQARRTGETIIRTIPGFSLPKNTPKPIVELDTSFFQPADENSSEDILFDLAEIEKKTVIAALSRSGGVHTRAARLLGITRQALDRRIERYSLET